MKLIFNEVIDAVFSLKIKFYMLKSKNIIKSLNINYIILA
jgi:hypothetical protein